VLIRGTGVEGVLARCRGREVVLVAERVVLAAGAYGSPAILLRSGIGSPGSLEPLGIDVNAPLPGVGANLRDHPTVDVQFQPSGRLRSETARHVAKDRPAAQCLLKAQGTVGGHEGWNLVLGPWTALETGNGHAGILVTVSKPRSAGRVCLRGADPDALPSVEHGFLSDDEGHDLAVLLEGVELARRLGETQAMRAFRAEPASLLPDARAALEEWARTRVAGNYHACGTCRMGPDGDAGAVVDPTGRVHGVENLYVADASILPTIPRANIHLTVLAVAERIAELIQGANQRNRIT
jgi:choline dehydrogenase